MLAFAPSTADALEAHASLNDQACMIIKLRAEPPLEQDWSRQSTAVPDDDEEAAESVGELEVKLLGAPGLLLPHASHESTASGSLCSDSGSSTPAGTEGGADEASGDEEDDAEATLRGGLAARRQALVVQDLGDLSETDDEDAVRRIGLAARRLALNRADDRDLGDLSESDDEDAVRRIGLAARRLALNRADDSDTDSEVEEAAFRLGRCARLWAMSNPGAQSSQTCGPPAGARAGGDAESEGEEDDIEGFLKAVRCFAEQEAEL